VVEVNIEHQVETGVLKVKVLDKRMDARGAPDFKERVGGLIKAGNRWIALDLSEVEFIDSSGLGALVSVVRQLGGQGEMAIGGVRDTVASLFRLTRLDKVFQMYPDAARALVAVSGH
jgi:anti-sigma B factor antagonist